MRKNTPQKEYTTEKSNMFDYTKYAPSDVFGYFAEICSIPHGSGNTEKIAEYIVSFAEEHNLSCRHDGFDNIIIRKPASPGYEDHEPVILQGHIDMVTQKTPDCGKNLETDGLDIDTDGEWIFARETTLGGDDGIAVAYCLAILADDTLEHPPIEVLLTADEETGMDGAHGIDMFDIKGNRMINLDSEEEGYFLVSCAGGCSLSVDMQLEKTDCKSLRYYSVTVDGLKGGHSGQEINKGRANANKLLAKFLAFANFENPVYLCSLSGGDKDNAIPRRADAVFATVTPFNQINSFARRMQEFAMKKYGKNDPGISVTVRTAAPAPAYAASDFVTMFNSLPDGVQALDSNVKGLVETSLNTGIASFGCGKAHLSFSVRSSVNAKKEALVASVCETAAKFGAEYSVNSMYPAWEYRENSPLRDTMTKVFARLYGEKPKIISIHAGLECGLFLEKKPGLDTVSIGPDMQDIHTVGEKLSIASVHRTYVFLQNVLKEL